MKRKSSADLVNKVEHPTSLGCMKHVIRMGYLHKPGSARGATVPFAGAEGLGLLIYSPLDSRIRTR